MVTVQPTLAWQLVPRQDFNLLSYPFTSSRFHPLPSERLASKPLKLCDRQAVWTPSLDFVKTNDQRLLIGSSTLPPVRLYLTRSYEGRLKRQTSQLELVSTNLVPTQYQLSTQFSSKESERVIGNASGSMKVWKRPANCVRMLAHVDDEALDSIGQWARQTSVLGAGQMVEKQWTGSGQVLDKHQILSIGQTV